MAWSRSTADVVAYTDVDLSTELEALVKLCRTILDEGYDLGTGSRLLPESRTTRGPKREFISRCYNRLVKLVLWTSFSDAQCGFKAVSRRVVDEVMPQVKDQSWFFDTELLLLAEHNGLRVHEVPVDWVDDPDSRVDVRRTATDDLKGVWRMARSFVSGGGRLDLVPLRRAPLSEDFGRQLVGFAAVGLLSTSVSLLLFLLLKNYLSQSMMKIFL